MPRNILLASSLQTGGIRHLLEGANEYKVLSWQVIETRMDG